MEKNHGIWKNRPAVQKAFDADPQRAYQAVVKALRDTNCHEAVAPLIEASLCPQPTNDELRAELEWAREKVKAHGLDTGNIDRRLAELA